MVINFGGNCETADAIKILKIPNIPSPFDWLGIATQNMPNILTSNWYEDVFDLKNILTYPSPNSDYIGVKDLKYGINSLHAFRRKNNINYHRIVEELLPSFRDKLKTRWQKMREELRQHQFILYRDYFPLYLTKINQEKQTLLLTCEAIIKFAPPAHLIVVSDNILLDPIPNATVVIQNPAVSYGKYKLTPKWETAWEFIATNLNDLKKCQIYNPNYLGIKNTGIKNIPLL